MVIKHLYWIILCNSWHNELEYLEKGKMQLLCLLLMQYNQIKIYSNNNSLVSLHSLGILARLNLAAVELYMPELHWCMGIPEKLRIPNFCGEKNKYTHMKYTCVYMLCWAKFSLFPEVQLNSAQLVPPLTRGSGATATGRESAPAPRPRWFVLLSSSWFPVEICIMKSKSVDWSSQFRSPSSATLKSHSSASPAHRVPLAVTPPAVGRWGLIYLYCKDSW